MKTSRGSRPRGSSSRDAHLHDPVNRDLMCPVVNWAASNARPAIVVVVIAFSFIAIAHVIVVRDRSRSSM